ncbi:MAG: HAD domain-containing protein [Rhodoferax sp.]
MLYLDFDGVLHHEDICLNTKRGLYFGSNAQTHGARHDHTHRLFEHALLLAKLLEPHPNVQIVLSTSWVRWRGYEHVRDRLPAELARRCVGAHRD